MMRAFVAVPLTGSIQERLQEVAGRLKQLEIHARFPPVSLIHLTLKFLGRTSPEQLEEIERRIATSAEGISPFQVDVMGLGAFPSSVRPRVVWIGVDRNRQLSLLKEKLESHLNPLGFDPDDRKFRPHLTLARLKSRRNLSRLIQFLHDQGRNEVAGKLPVHRIQLMESILRPEGAKYRERFSVALESSEEGDV